MTHADPGALVEALNDWARRTDWVDWVEIGGSIGRGAGDELSDVDAGIGVLALADHPSRIDDARTAMHAFAPVAASLTQILGGDTTHLISVYEDGRQLSLVVLDAEARQGLPPQAVATVDKSGRLSRSLDQSRWDADEATVREWAFLAWIAIGDAARHRLRGRTWRALHALTDARDHLWRLWAHSHGLAFPMFGAVTVENAGADLPPGIEATHPGDLSAAAIHRALTALARLLEPYTAGDLAALADTVRARLDLLESSISTA
jgi:hypothetical protein